MTSESTEQLAYIELKNKIQIEKTKEKMCQWKHADHEEGTGVDLDLHLNPRSSLRTL